MAKQKVPENEVVMHTYSVLSPSCMLSHLIVIASPGSQQGLSIMVPSSCLFFSLSTSLPCHLCRKLKPREFKWLKQGHTARRRQKCDLKLDLLDSCFCFTLMLPFFSLSLLKSPFLSSRAKCLTVSSLTLSQIFHFANWPFHYWLELGPEEQTIPLVGFFTFWGAILSARQANNF